MPTLTSWPSHRLYALEAFAGFFAPAPFTVNSGKVVRLNKSGGWDTIASGLNFPTAMTLGPDGKFYVSNCGFWCPAGAGQGMRIDVGSYARDYKWREAQRRASPLSLVAVSAAPRS